MTDDPSGVRRLLQPSSLQPVRLDLGIVFRIGTVIWLVVAGVVAVLVVQDRVAPQALWTCATGAVLGVLGAIWARRHRPDPTETDADGAGRPRPAQSPR